MGKNEPRAKPLLSGPVLALSGLLLAAGAWMLPANIRSISPVLLRAAGSGTPGLGAFGGQLVEGEKIGPALLVLTAAHAAGDPAAPALAGALEKLAARQPAFVSWGGWDPFLDPLFNLRSPEGRAASTPVLTFILPEAARGRLREYLSSSGSIGVQAILRTREVTGGTGRFIPAARPGGQPLDALILLTALLYQGDRLSPALQRELHGLADGAAARNDLGALGAFYLDLMALGRRLDWMQLCELLRRADSSRTVGEFARLSRVAPDAFALVYSAALLTESADRVAAYVIQFGKTGAEDLRLAASLGRGAIRELVARQLAVNRSGGPVLAWASDLVLEYPTAMLAARYFGFFLGLYLILRGLDAWTAAPGGYGPEPRRALSARAGVLALLLSFLMVVATEPFLLKAAPASEYKVEVRLPMLAASGALPGPPSPSQNIATMTTSTVVSIAVFALLQVAMYYICLQKMAQIARQDAPPLLKLRLMENEENLFDSGLYVGMMGTAAALVLQVLGVIEPNLLAAYSSNLFGIVCVALVKIRHVRGFKRRLILENEARSVA